MPNEHDHANMKHDNHSHDHHESLNKTAFMATLHCMTGCSIGEILGMALGTWLGLTNASIILLSVVLAFVTGYSLTLVPLLKADISISKAWKLALASDTASITIMEIVDNGLMLVIPGAMTAGLTNLTFWGSLLLSIVLAGAVAFPVVRWLISQGKGHAVVHQYHGHSH